MQVPGLESKSVVVTGGGGRLGSRIVRHFAQAGARVSAITASDAEAARIPVDSSGHTSIVKAKVTDESSVASTFREIAKTMGRVDALIHTVGMWGQSPLLDTSQSTWEDMIRVNLTSTFLCFREAVRHMNGQGTLIAISSRQGADAGAEGQAAYSAAKAGIIRLVEAVSREYGGRIRAHAIAPSTILFDEEGNGVFADDLVSLAAYLVSDAGAALGGSTIRAYGTG